ncbi:Alpha/beta hydrolase family protein [Gimesia panareensis]|uniref:Alpha/beta hydrolase family protein n=1 Tax=Gimesia panareensis TaxID=2527978 RepID=A0A517Q926_9PLAN|nr:hypothetical protein [Gimesia panareensis]QDT28139.1 Alpha/beta hydrolase family protein [Gimesia panareensis]
MFQRLWSTCLDEILGFYLLHRFFYHKKQPLLISDASHHTPQLHSGELTSFFSPKPPPAQLEYQAELRPTSQATFPSAKVEDFQFPSTVDTGFPENDCVKGRHWKSTVASPQTEVESRLTVVAVDGIVQLGVRSFNRLAQQLTPHGIDVVMLDSPFNFRRTPAGYRPGQLIAGGNLDHQLMVARQGILDLWSLILALQAEGRQIGLMGISHGAWLTLTATLLIEQLQFAIAITPPVDLLRILEEGGTVVNAIRRGASHDPPEEEQLEQLCKPLRLNQWQPLLAPEQIHLHIADFDRFVPSARIAELAEQWGTRVSHHKLGHIEATTGPKVVFQVARDILDLYQ